MQIELQNVNYIYNKGTTEELQAIKDVSLKVEGSSFIAIIGSTGSGKSTLIQLFNGLLKPTSGTILFDGVDIYSRQVTNKKEEKKMLRDLRCRVGLAFQYPEHQLFEETVFKDVSFGPKNLGLDPEETDRRVRKALADVNVDEDYYEKSPFDLSGGEMRRVALAGILAMEPELLILDEPTAGLDPLGKVEILNKLKSLQKERNMIVILVSHAMEEVAEYADRVIALRDGQVVMDGDTHEVFRDGELLQSLGLKAPAMKYFMEDLESEGFFGDTDTNAITVAEAKDLILKALK